MSIPRLLTVLSTVTLATALLAFGAPSHPWANSGAPDAYEPQAFSAQSVITPIATATAPAVQFPRDYRLRYTHYATVKRPDALRELYMNPEALDALRQGQPLPEDAQIVMEVYKGGRLVSLSVRQRRMGGDARLPDNLRNGDWHYLEVDTAKPSKASADETACHACHSRAYTQDYLFTLNELRAFAQTGVVQQTTCNRLGRRPCMP